MRWKCTVSYDGTGYDGWQSQPGGNTIQDLIEARLQIFFRKRVAIHGSGRTDSGVHARGQVFHFSADWKHGPDNLIKALRPGYPDSIHVYRAECVPDDFHARFSAVGKRYIYQFHEGQASPFDTRWYWSTGYRRLDTARMQQAAALLVGQHDFSSFSANPKDNREDNPVKNLCRLEITRDGPRIFMTAEADGFLYRMVRSLAGCLFDVGIGKLEPDAMPEILEMRKRTNLVYTAPPQGLFLDEVWYEV